MPSPSSSSPSTTLGPYRLGELLGKGGMGRVYRAFDQRLDRWVAAKCLHREATARDRERFSREARTLARLGHPAIVQIFDIVQDGGDDWIVMELVDGPTLSSMRRAAPIEAPRVIDYAKQIASALEAAHSHGIIHRDLKSENVMVLASGHIKVLDFGLAFRLASDSADRTWGGSELAKIAEPGLTEPGRLLGTPRAMAPEQILELELDARSDLFSFGILLYEILTGRAPFLGGSVPDVLRRVVYDRLPPVADVVPDVPPRLSKLIGRLTEKDPFERPQTAAEVAAELAAIATPEADTKPSESSIDVPAGRPFVSEDTPYRSLGERRQVTVFCCDLAHPVEDSAIGEKPELETLTESLPAFLDVANQIVERYQGTPGALTGSRFMAYFGYPAAHEDGAVRAVRAALELIEAWRSASDEPRRLALRIGIHSGPAVIAPGESRDPLMLGSTFDHTVEVQSLATVDSVVVSAGTRQLVWRSFELEALSSETRAWQVLAAHQPQGADAMTLELLPMVSRAHELDLLLGRWRASTQGRGQVILISGEAGIGKSRLTRAFRSGLPDRSTRWWIAHGSPFLQDSPLAPIADMLRHEVLRRQRDEEPEIHLDRLEVFLDPFDLPRDEIASLFANLLEIPTDGRYAVPELSPDERRHQTLEALVALFTEMADERPWVLAIEDLHWMDPSTLELLDRVVERAGSTSLCVLATCRPDGLPSWQHGTALTRIHLDQLTDEDGELLIDHVAGGQHLASEIRQQILDRADGVPLFIEELTKTVLETDAADSVSIPSTLRDSLTARLDRLGSAKQVAETAATVGRSFNLELLSAIDSRDVATLRRELDRLNEAGLIFRKGFGSSQRYVFKHALIQDIAYDALLRKDRQALHRRIGAVLIDRFPEVRDKQPEIVAHHLTEGGEIAAAIPYWRRAGQAALAASAQLEAMHHLERALGLIETLDDREAHRTEELTVLGGLGTALILNVGFTAPEVEAVWQRAHTLCEISGAPSFDVLWGLYAFHSVRGEWWQTGSITDQMLSFAAEREAPMLDLQSHYLAGVRHFFIGQPLHCLTRLDQASRFDSSDLGPVMIASFAQDSRVMVRNYQALALWLTGAATESAERSRRAHEMANAGGHPFTISTTLLLACILDLFRRDGAAAEDKAEGVIELARHHGLYLDRDGQALLACARVLRLRADDRERAAELAEALAESQRQLVDSGSRVWSPFYTMHWAEACRIAGDLDQAVTLLDQALGDIDAHGECFWQAEVTRQRGDVEAARGNTDGALDRYRIAERIADEQGARALEDRARASSIRLQQPA